MESIKTLHSIKHNYTLRYWINKKNIDNYGWEGLSANTNATEMLIKQIEYIKYFTEDNYKKLKSKIDWCKLLANPSILNYLLKDLKLPSNKYLTSLLLDPNKSNDLLILRFKDEYLKGLSSNPNAIKILEQHPDIIDYDNLFLNPNPNASKLLRPNYKITEQLKIKKICRLHNLEEIKSLKKPDWDELYSNPIMIDLIHKKVNN